VFHEGAAERSRRERAVQFAKVVFARLRRFCRTRSGKSILPAQRCRASAAIAHQVQRHMAALQRFAGASQTQAGASMRASCETAERWTNLRHIRGQSGQTGRRAEEPSVSV
jgi:hypothetical protein